MDAEGRQKFWDVLSNMHDCLPQNIEKLREAAPCPQELCRFRSVNESTLKQLQDNTLWFSSADYYDDPFDTYFYIDNKEFERFYNTFNPLYLSGDKSAADMVNVAADLIGANLEDFKKDLAKTPTDFSSLNNELKDIGEEIKKILFSICFCENPLNETLWIKYADNYKGFVAIYNFNDKSTFECEKVDRHSSNTSLPNIFPVYYSDTRYNASRYAMALYVIDVLLRKDDPTLLWLIKSIGNNILWEAERITLIKKKCHENDEEWRMLRPQMVKERTYINAKPDKIILGLRMPEDERHLVISAVKIAGVKQIHEIFINELDELDSRPIKED